MQAQRGRSRSSLLVTARLSRVCLRRWGCWLCCFFFSSRRRHTISVSAFLLNRSSDLYYTLSIVRCLDLLDCNQHCYSLFLGLLLSDERKMLVSTSIVLKFTVFLGLGLPPFWDRGEGFYLLGSGNRGKTVDFLRFEPIANSD